MPTVVLLRSISSRHLIVAAGFGGELPRASIAVTLFIDAVLAFQSTVLVVAHYPHKYTILKPLLAHEQPAFSITAAHESGLAGDGAAIAWVHRLSIEFADLYGLAGH